MRYCLLEMELQYEPFPHLVVDDFLGAQLFQSVLQHYPSADDMREQGRLSSQHRYNFMRGSKAQQELVANEPWSQLDHYLRSSFVDEMLIAFAPALKHFKADFERKDLACGYDISRAGKGYKRSCHLDRRHHLIAFLLYFNERKDYGGSGGELLLYGSRPADVWDKFPPPEQVQTHTAVEPKSNRLVAFANTYNAYHGITPMIGNQSDRIFLYASLDCSSKKTVWPDERVGVLSESRRLRFIAE